jgi:hypothetical protein
VFKPSIASPACALFSTADGFVSIVGPKNICGIRRKADRIPTEGGQQSDDCGQPMIAA